MGARPKLSRVAADGTFRPLQPPAGQTPSDPEDSVVLSLADVQADQDLPSPKPIPRESGPESETSSGLSSSGAWRMGSSGTVLRPQTRPAPPKPTYRRPRVGDWLVLLWVAAFWWCLPGVAYATAPLGWPQTLGLSRAVILFAWLVGVVLLLAALIWRLRQVRGVEPPAASRARTNRLSAACPALLLVAAGGLTVVLLVGSELSAWPDGEVLPLALAGLQVLGVLLGAGLWTASTLRLRGSAGEASTPAS